MAIGKRFQAFDLYSVTVIVFWWIIIYNGWNLLSYGSIDVRTSFTWLYEHACYIDGVMNCLKIIESIYNHTETRSRLVGIYSWTQNFISFVLIFIPVGCHDSCYLFPPPSLTIQDISAYHMYIYTFLGIFYSCRWWL